jgi:hypothetical protein
MDEYRYHRFTLCWNLDRDLYMEAIENHMSFPTFILETHGEDYSDHLKRGGIVITLKEGRR